MLCFLFCYVSLFIMFCSLLCSVQILCRVLFFIVFCSLSRSAFYCVLFFVAFRSFAAFCSDTLYSVLFRYLLSCYFLFPF